MELGAAWSAGTCPWPWVALRVHYKSGSVQGTEVKIIILIFFVFPMDGKEKKKNPFIVIISWWD